MCRTGKCFITESLHWLKPAQFYANKPNKPITWHGWSCLTNLRRLQMPTGQKQRLLLAANLPFDQCSNAKFCLFGVDLKIYAFKLCLTWCVQASHQCFACVVIVYCVPLISGTYQRHVVNISAFTCQYWDNAAIGFVILTCKNLAYYASICLTPLHYMKHEALCVCFFYFLCVRLCFCNCATSTTSLSGSLRILRDHSKL